MILRPHPKAWLLLAPLLLVLAACGQRFTAGSLEPLADAARAVDGGSEKGRHLAFAAWEAWLVRGDAARAEALAARALERDPRQPWAHLAVAEAARRRLDPRAEAEALLALIEAAPAHALAALAAEELAGLTGRSLTLDDRLRDAVAELLREEGLPPEARLRLLRVERRLLRGRDASAYAASVAAAGRLRRAAVVGPLSPFRHLDQGRAFPAYEEGPIPEAGPPLRSFELPAGRLSLASENSDGDLYYALAVASVPARGRYLLRLQAERGTSARLVVDGDELLSRVAFGPVAPLREALLVELDKGEHLFSLQVLRGRGAGEVAIDLLPLGGAGQVEFRAARPGDGARRGGARVVGAAMEGAAALASRLEPEAGILAAWAGARYGAAADPEGAIALVEAALRGLPGAPPLMVLRAELALGDRSIPRRIAEARAASDLDAVLDRDPAHPQALLLAAGLLRAADRHDEAHEKLEEAASAVPDAIPLRLARAELARDRDLEAQAVELARAAVEEGDASCQAAGLLYQVARSERAVAVADEVAGRFVGCPGGRQRLASLLTQRGRLNEAWALARDLLDEDPQSIGAGLRLSELALARGEPETGAAILEKLEAAWPRNATLPKRRSELLLLAGDEAGAEAARARALALDGGDLALRREAALAGRGDLLASYDRDGLEVVRAFDREGKAYDAPAVVLFDFAAVEVFADGSQLERVHTLTRILDKRGIDRHGEAHLPPGAELLQLRTIKKDGRLLEPEIIGGKDSVSLPGLEVGDTVEIAYLRARSERGPTLPGWAATPFYFRVAQEPVAEALYVVRAHKDAGLELDLHNGAPAGERYDDGDAEVLRIHVLDSPAFIPEPSSVSYDEILPWVQVGAGAGEREMACSVADALQGSLAWNREVAAWARAVAAEAGPDRLAVVRALWDRVMEEIEGNDQSFRSPASFVLASKRGNRLVLLQAALEVLGIENSLALVRTFERDPANRRFPEPRLWGKVVLVVRPDPKAGWTWLDPSVRWAPFGELPPAAQGASAWLLPKAGYHQGSLPGSPCIATRTPAPGDAIGQEVELHLEILPDGSLIGQGRDRYHGYEAAFARNSLERMNEDSRRQAIETSLGKGFRGLVLDDLQIESEGEQVLITYAFHVPDYLRVFPDGSIVAELSFAREELGKSLLHRGERESPLLLRSTRRSVLDVQLTLPEGMRVARLPQAARELSEFGSYRRAVAEVDGKVALRDELHLARGRILPAAYGAFAAWVNGVDRAQASDLLLEERGAGAAAAR